MHHRFQHRDQAVELLAILTAIFGDDGNHVPVTVVKAGPCTIVGIRKKETHGYDALELGFEPI